MKPDAQMLPEPMQRLVRPERNDHIHVGSLSPLAFDSLSKLAEAAEWHPVQTWMPPELVLLFIERLKHTKDDGDVFPKWKWATIQRLEQLFADGMWSNESS